MSVPKSRFATAFEAWQTAEQVAADLCAARRREAGPDRRRARRSDHAEPADMGAPQGPMAVSVQNLSTCGDAVLLPGGAALDTGESVSLQLSDGRHLHGRIVWREPGRAGLMFDDELATVDDIVHFECRAAAVYSRMARRATRRLDS